MKTCKVLSAMLFISISSYGQWYPELQKVDTITTGDYEDANPVLYHGTAEYGNWDGYQWLLFNRHTDTASIVAAKKFLMDDAEWDSTIVVISSTTPDKPQRKPEISNLAYWESDNTPHSFWIAAWERREDTVWNIFYSRLLNGDSMWSEPQVLTADSIDNTTVQIRPVRDSIFIAIWKRKGALLYSLITPHSVSSVDTMATSAIDSLEFDVVTRFDQGLVVWTSRDTSGKNIMIARTFPTYTSFSLTEPESLFFRGSAFNPQLAVSPFVEKVILFETELNSNREVLVWQGYNNEDHTVENVSNDSLADDYNPCAFGLPMITKQSARMVKTFYFYYDVLAMEKYTQTDTFLFFSTNYLSSDTVRSIGYNRNICLSSLPFYADGYMNVLSVWESNRSGRSHIYARRNILPTWGVDDEPSMVSTFALKQNYPNPFNPSTTLEYRLPKRAHVTIKIFDVIGHEVAVLVNEEKDAGTFKATWNAARFSSGMYFARMMTGSFAATKKLLLVK